MKLWNSSLYTAKPLRIFRKPILDDIRRICKYLGVSLGQNNSFHILLSILDFTVTFTSADISEIKRTERQIRRLCHMWRGSRSCRIQQQNVRELMEKGTSRNLVNSYSLSVYRVAEKNTVISIYKINVS